jgi:hypothetical protein
MVVDSFLIQKDSPALFRSWQSTESGFRRPATVRPSEILPQYRETVRQLVLEAGMANPRIFGSVARGEDEDGSDLDILVDPTPRASLLTMVSLQRELELATGIKIDLRTPGELHPRLREKVMSEASLL